MTEVRALELFQERLKSVLGSLLEVLLEEITEAFRQSVAHCERCAITCPESVRMKDRDVSGDSQLLMSFQCSEPVYESEEIIRPCPSQESPPLLTDPSEEKDIQIEMIQTGDVLLSLTEKVETPKASEELAVTSGPDVKQEYEDVAVMTEEEDEGETTRLEETRACQTSCESPGAQLKPEDHEGAEESRWSPASSDGYFCSVRSQITQSCLINPASAERRGPVQKDGAPLRACSVLLRRPEILQRAAGRLYICSVCDKMFMYRRSLRRHRRFHTGERPHGCSLCSRAFILRRTLREHTRAHFRRPYSCTQCERRFKHWRKLRLHWRSHAGESPFICSRCGKHCRTLKSLDRHLAYVSHD